MNIRIVLALGLFSCLAVVPGAVSARSGGGANVYWAAMAVVPGAVPAQPETAIFYPTEVQVTVKERLRPSVIPSGEQGFVLTLPQETRSDGFFVNIKGSPAPLYYWLERKGARPVPARDRSQPPSLEGPLVPQDEPLPERRALLENRLALKVQEAHLEGELAAISARLAIWSATPPQDKGLQVDSLVKLDTLVAERVPALHEAKETKARDLEQVRGKLTVAEEELRRFDGSHRFQTVIVPFAEKTDQPLEISYGYTLPAMSAISYSLNAEPGKESLTVAQDALLRQTSGFAWKDVEVLISTSRRETGDGPRNPIPWRIALRGPELAEYSKAAPMVLAEPARMAKNSLRQDEVADDDGDSTEQRARMAAPVQEERATFRLWKLGKQSLGNDTPVRLPLALDTYKADFSYTLRPALGPKGFLTAELNLQKPLELPRGVARLLVDGVAVGERTFTFNGDKGAIFFGSDPQVTAVMRDVTRMRGEQGLLRKEKTESWHWEITLKSTRPTPVKVRVEDPAPQIADESIKLTVQSTLKPGEVTLAPDQGSVRVFRWECTLNPGEPVIIEHKVQAAAPADKELDPGRDVE